MAADPHDFDARRKTLGVPRKSDNPIQLHSERCNFVDADSPLTHRSHDARVVGKSHPGGERERVAPDCIKCARARLPASTLPKCRAGAYSGRIA